MTTLLRTSLAASLLASSSAAWAQPATTPATPPQNQNAMQPAAATQPNDKTLKPVNVTEAQDREATGYNPAVSTVGKTAQALKDIPNSVTVVPEQLMHDRGADTMKEALRNVAGLTFNAGEGGRVGDNITLRGFSVVGDLYLDNIRDIAQYNRESFNLESIDVLRGSASVLYGRGSAGGLINQVSKAPRLFGFSEVTATVGTDGYKRVHADLSKAVSDTMAIRVNALAHDAGSFRDHVKNKRQAVAPSISWGIGTPDLFALAYYHLNENNIPDYGVPYLAGAVGTPSLPLLVPVNTFYGLANADFEKNSAGIATGSYVHKIGPTSSVKTVLRAANYARNLWATAPRLIAATLPLSATTQLNRARQARGGEEKSVTSQTDFTFNLNAGGIKHDMLAGLELAQEKSNRWTNANGSANPPTAATQVTNPIAIALAPDANPTLPSTYFSTQFRYNPNSYVARTTGIYVQDTASLNAHWKLVAGLRWDDFKSDYERTAPLTPLSRSDKVLSKKLGVLFQPTDTSTFYASWGTSFNPSGELYQLDVAGSNTPPELNRNIEMGAKWDLLNGDLSLRTAAYRTEKTNERNTDVASPNLFLLSGKRHTSGVELEAAGRITPQWEVFAAFAVQNGNIDVASGQQAGSQDKRPINTPNHTASLWSTYKLNASWKVGGGIESIGLRYANANNTAALPEYVRVDAMAEYKWEWWSVQVNAKNLLNKDYYEGVYAGHTVPGTKRAVTVAVGYKF